MKFDRITTAALLVLAFAEGGQAARAQGGALDTQAPKAPEVASKSDHLVLEDRERERMHPGDALNLVGIDEGSPEFRKRTPSLTRNVGSAVMIDPDELYEQRLAMYTEGAKASRPLKPLDRNDARVRAEQDPVEPTAIAPADAAGAAKKPWWRRTWVWIVTGIGVVGMFLRRRMG